MKRTQRTYAALLAAISLPLLSSAVLAQWSSWRGPGDAGVSFETDLPEKIDGNILWRKPLGGGRSTPIVQDGRVVLVTRAGRGPTQHERLISYDGETGKIVWEDPINVFHTTIPGPRIGWASPVGDPETGNIYFHGIQGIFNCYDRDGKVLWSRSLTEEFGRISGYGGRTNTPIVDEELVILSFLNSSWGDQGKGSHRYVAFDKRSGEVRWWASPGGAPLDTTYSTPVVAVINGVRQLIVGCADGWIYGLMARTGETIWSFHLSKRGINVSPVVSGTNVYVSHSEENVDSTAMGRLVCIDATGTGDVTKTHEKWRFDEVTVGYASPAAHDGVVYVIDNSANLYAIEAETGKRLWEHSIGTVGKASPVVADGKIYIGEVNGRFHILQPTRESCTSLASIHLKRSSDGTDNEVFGSCAVGNGRVYLPTRDEIICIGEKSWSGKSVKAPALAAEKDFGTTPATMLLTPAEVLVAPGQIVSFRARLYNESGQYLRDATDASFAIQGVSGSVDAKGKYSIPTPVATGLQAGLVTATSGGLSASARVRVVPPPPLKIEFAANDKLPGGWIGLSPIKFKITELDGRKVLHKHGESQRFARALAYIGPPELANYTIQADVRGSFRRRTLPDMGLLNSRYRLALIGVDQVLRVLTWVPEKRLEKDVPFEWKEDVWYRMIFSVIQKGDAALIRAKVWPRDEKEPGAWTVEVEDPFPHRIGSPGVYAYTAGTTARSAGTDVYFDNIIVNVE